MIRWHGLKLDSSLEPEIPFPFHVEKSFCKVGVDVRMYAQQKVFFILFADEITDVVLNIVGYQDTGPYLAGAVAGGAFFQDLDIHFRADPLACDLYQSELAWRKNGVLGAVSASSLP